MGLSSVLLSNISAMLIAFKLYRDWDFRVSSIRWLFFFIYLWLYTIGPARYYLWVVMLPIKEFVDGNNAVPYTSKQLDQLGIYATTDLKAARRAFPTTILSVCDVMHFAVAFWVLPLIYELLKIAAKSMDRGTAKEKAKIRMYVIVGHGLIACFLIAEVGLSVLGGGYSSYTYRLALCIYIMQMVMLVYMGVVLLLLKCKGRDVESINGQFETSPVYKRLKWIMFAYALFAIQYEATSLFTYLFTPRGEATLRYIGLSQVMYNATGFALALCTGCSLPCVLRFRGCCIPDEMLAQLVVVSNRGEMPCFHERDESITPPVLNPVFLVTDIESSSALWGIEDAAAACCRLTQGSSWNCASDEEARAIHGAALNGYHKVVAFLAQNRVEGPSERTLEMAASAGHFSCVKALCKYAQPPPHGSGMWKFAAARQCALDAGHKEIARFLTEQEESGSGGGSTKEKKRWCFGLF